MNKIIIFLILQSFWLSGEGAGTIADPILIDQFPYVKTGTTTGAPEMIDRYSCSSANEGGPEMIYRFTVTEPGNLTGWVVGDGNGVDIDIYLLSSLNISGGEGTDCMVRNNKHFEYQNLQPGDYYIVVDSFVESSGAVGDGPYELWLDFVPYNVFVDRIIGKGVTWRRKIYPSLFDHRQSVNILKIDPEESSVVLKPIAASGCETVASMGERVGATAVINAGFFSTADCSPVSYMKVDGVRITSGMYATGMGITAAGVPLLKRTNGSWDGIHQAIGGGPRLLQNSEIDVAQDEGFDYGFINYRHPRSGGCFNSETGEIQLLTVDGRTDAGGGMALPDLAQYMAWLSCDFGVNYDGGGSTSMWIGGQPFGGIVSYPSDNKIADHFGARRVSSGWGIWAEPYNHPPRFQTEAITSVLEGENYYYDADALDMNPYDQLIFSLKTAPPGMSVDQDGVVRWRTKPGSYEVVLVVSDGVNSVEQLFTLFVPGVVDPCEPNPCTTAHKTVCGNSNGTAVCSCDNGYEPSGEQCVLIVVDPCENHHCNATFICGVINGAATCICPAGKVEENGLCVTPQSNPCDPNPCSEANRSICTVQGDQAVCLCDSGYIDNGGSCIINQNDPCNTHQCETSHICVVQGDTPLCLCPNGETEVDGVCKVIDLNPCDPNPCQEENRTNCQVSGVDALCLCDEGYVENESYQCVKKAPASGVSASGDSGCHYGGNGSEGWILLLLFAGLIICSIFVNKS